MLEAEAATADGASSPLSVFPFICNQVKYFSVINEILRHQEDDSPPPATDPWWQEIRAALLRICQGFDAAAGLNVPWQPDRGLMHSFFCLLLFSPFIQTELSVID